MSEYTKAKTDKYGNATIGYVYWLEAGVRRLQARLSVLRQAAIDAAKPVCQEADAFEAEARRLQAENRRPNAELYGTETIT